MAVVYLYNDEGYYIGVGETIPHPFGLGEESVPNNATLVEVLEEKEGHMIRHYFADESEELVERWLYEKILSEEEQKIAGSLSLVDGEYVKDGVLITVEAPNILYTWNKETDAWELDAEKVAKMKLGMYSSVSEKRETVLETGYEFETGKLIKGRDKDLTRALAVYTNFRDGIAVDEAGNIIPIVWQFSNGFYEQVDTVERMKQIFFGVSKFISQTCTIDGTLKLYLNTITDPEVLLNIDIDSEWQKLHNKLNPVTVVEEEVIV